MKPVNAVNVLFNVAIASCCVTVKLVDCIENKTKHKKQKQFGIPVQVIFTFKAHNSSRLH